MTKKNPPVHTEITPQMAERWLERNPRNRNVRPGKVARIRDDILAGLWDSSICNPIRFNRDGELVDGQHRLLAIVAADVPVVAWIEHDVDSLHIDEAESRRIGDILSMNGIVVRGEGRQAQSIINSINLITNLRASNRQWTPHSVKGNGISNEKAMEMALKIDNFDALVKKSNGIYKAQPRMARIFTQSAAGALLHFAEMDIGAADEAEEFLRRITSGENLRRGDPELAYRKWAQSIPSLIRYRTDIAALFHVFRKHIEGSDVLIIKQASIGDISRFVR